MESGYQERHITLKFRRLDGRTEYQWIRDDEEPVSPIFTSLNAAQYFAGRIPFLTQAEWDERDADECRSVSGHYIALTPNPLH